MLHLHPHIWICYSIIVVFLSRSKKEVLTSSYPSTTYSNKASSHVLTHSPFIRNQPTPRRNSPEEMEQKGCLKEVLQTSPFDVVPSRRLDNAPADRDKELSSQFSIKYFSTHCHWKTDGCFVFIYSLNIWCQNLFNGNSVRKEPPRELIPGILSLT